MAKIETKEQLEKIKVAYEEVKKARLSVEKVNAAANDKRRALGNLLGIQATDVRLEEEAIRQIGEAYLENLHEKE